MTNEQATYETAPGFWGVFGDFLRDFLEQDIPGSVVLLLIFVALAPAVFSLIKAWIGRGPYK